MDTTKDYYEDSEAPEFQIQVTNGVEKKVPWAEVPEVQRYFFQFDDTPGATRSYKYRVPVVKVTITATDENGQPVSPDKAYYRSSLREGLNPKYRERGDRDPAH